jgi:hypothetical protein
LARLQSNIFAVVYRDAKCGHSSSEKEPRIGRRSRIDPNKVGVRLSAKLVIAISSSPSHPLPNVIPSPLPSPSMPAPTPGPATPLQSFLGGVGLALPAQALLSLNSRTFGISGFIHGAARGNLEDAMSVLGLVSGGFVVAAIEGTKPTIVDSAPLPLVLSGLLVGVGAKVRFQSP